MNISCIENLRTPVKWAAENKHLVIGIHPSSVCYDRLWLFCYFDILSATRNEHQWISTEDTYLGAERFVFLTEIRSIPKILDEMSTVENCI